MSRQIRKLPVTLRRSLTWDRGLQMAQHKAFTVATDFNDVWKFDAATKMWTWMGGADTPYALGVYGTQGVAAASNMPGARWRAVGWTDSNGDFWLFAG